MKKRTEKCNECNRIAKYNVCNSDISFEILPNGDMKELPELVVYGCDSIYYCEKHFNK